MSEPMLEKITWPVVALVGIVMAAVVCLAAFRADTAVILAVLGVLGLSGLAGGGIAALNGIKANVNGNLSQLTTLLGRALERLAESQPPEGKP